MTAVAVSHAGRRRGNGGGCASSDSYNPQAVLRGLELLGRHLAMFTDKTISKTTIENMTDAEIADYVRCQNGSETAFHDCLLR